MNICTFTGNVGKDAEVRHTANGMAIASFSFATRTGFGDKAKTMWLRCIIFGKRAESGLIPLLTKGKKIVVSGELSENEWTTQDGTQRKDLELKVSEIELVEPKGPPQEHHKAPSEAPAEEAFSDDIPF